LPDELHDRAQDITEPLLAIADMAGEYWPEKARAALIKIYKGEDSEDSDVGIKLLRDIKAIFDESGEDKLSTRFIISELVENADDAPWPIWFEDDRNGTLKKAGSSLARKLKRFKIKPEKLRFGDETLQGYRRSQFETAWDRLLTVHSLAPENNGTNGTDRTPPSFTRGNDVPITVEPTRNVPLSVNPERNTEYEGETANVPSVPSVPSNLDGEQDAEFEADYQQFLKEVGEPATPKNREWLRSFKASKNVYPGGWLALYPEDARCPEWSRTLMDALTKPCDTCGEHMGNDPCVWLHYQTNAVQCVVCREAHWWADGYEIDEQGYPSCWHHSHNREERIAERTFKLGSKAGEWLNTPKGQEWLSKLPPKDAMLEARLA
jgi:hypothetical protein